MRHFKSLTAFSQVHPSTFAHNNKKTKKVGFRKGTKWGQINSVVSLDYNLFSKSSIFSDIDVYQKLIHELD